MTDLQFSDAQAKAIYATPVIGQILVIAGPGSGKTLVIVERIFDLLESGEADPYDICAVTFTNKAARELSDRLEKRLGRKVKLGYVGTIHGLCLRLLEGYGDIAPLGYRRGITVLDEEQSDRELLAMAALCGHPKLALAKLKAERDTHQAFDKRRPESLVVAQYYQHLRHRNATDYQGLLNDASYLLDKGIVDGYRFLLVDEYQDVSTLDATIFNRLPVHNRFYVGDPDQAIYGFRGGDLSQILITTEICENSPLRPIKLETNYRSARVICEAAQRLITHNEHRVAKSTLAVNSAIAGCIESVEYDSASHEIMAVCSLISTMTTSSKIPAEQIAVLARTNYIADQFRQFARASCTWPIEDEGEPIDLQAMGYARAVLGMIAAPGNDYALELYIRAKDGARTCDQMKRAAALQQKPLATIYHGYDAEALRCETLARLPSLMRQHDCTQIAIDAVVELIATLPPDASVADLLLAQRSAERVQRKNARRGVAITTMHSAKGREWPCVFLIGLEQNVVPGKAGRNEIEEERRLVYVAATRAMDYLHLSHAKMRPTKWSKGAQVTTPSQFIAEMLSANVIPFKS